MQRDRRDILRWGLAGLTATVFPALACSPTSGSPARLPAPAPPSPAPSTAHEPCAQPLPAGLSQQDRSILAASQPAAAIVQHTPGHDGVLRLLARPLTRADAAHIDRLEACLRASLQASNRGVGLAAPQLGVGARAIVVMIGARSESPRVEFFVNPRIVQRSDDLTLDYEGCLSVPDVCGLVRRNRTVVVEHGMPEGTTRRLQVTGFDARIFQHEIDHLDGVLYIDRVEGGLQPKDRLKQLRDQLRKDHPELAMTPARHDGRPAIL